jgi:signal transduction histidine kinase/CheY-like chemotaxis protein
VRAAWRDDHTPADALQARGSGKNMNFHAGPKRGVSWLLSLAVTLLAGCSLAPPTGVDRLDRAQGADGPVITLPHSWNETEFIQGTRVDLTFGVAALAEPTSVYVARTGLTFRASVNGRFIDETGDANSPPINIASYRSTPTFRVPVKFLRIGPNTLTLELFAPAGSRYRQLGILYVGPAELVEELAFRRWLAFHAGPMAMGVILFAIGLVSLGLWSGRRDQDLFMLLTCGSLLWALQILLYQWPTPLLPERHWGVVIMSLYAWWPVLLGVFFLRFAYRQSRSLEWFAVAIAVTAAPALYLGDDFGWGLQASIGVRLCVLVFIGIALAAVLRYALELRTKTGYMLFVAGSIGVFVAIFDFVRSLYPDSDRVLILNPYSGVAVVLFTGWMLLERYHKAYAEFELLNRDLEQRVNQANVELHRRLDQVESARAAAEQASVAKSRFFAAASHDLRQPLHSLGLFASALRGVVGTSEGHDLVGRIGDSIGALDRLFDELLDVSRLDAGVVEVRRANLALQPLFDRLETGFVGEAVAKGLQLRFVPTTLAVNSDPILLERVLTNLVSNALRYTHRGGVLVGARRRGARVRVQVWDTGAGIAEDQRALIFDEFYQIGNPGRDRRQGLGLGLAIVRRLTVLLDHPLSVRSIAGRGSCFEVTLPVADGPVDATSREEGAPPASVLGVARALVIDDDPDICEATRRLLAGWGVEVRIAVGPEEAIACVREGFAPDVVLADLRLGHAVDGIGVVEQLRARLGRVPALLISGDTGARELARVKESGLLLLTKPVAPARLRSALHALLTAPPS